MLSLARHTTTNPELVFDDDGDDDDGDDGDDGDDDGVMMVTMMSIKKSEMLSEI